MTVIIYRAPSWGAVNLNLNARRRPNADSHRLLIVAFKSRQIAYGKESQK